jgi:2-keto-4-pentenoate hydratase/2-oxohepta-3-ene-1,7-dioic acid hydratase in catechol pathway
MRILHFSHTGRERAGVLTGNAVHDLSPFATLRGLANVIASGPSGRAVVAAWMERSETYDLNVVTVLPPVDDRTRTFCAALNYADHAAEAGRPLFDEPLMFLKLPSTLIGATEPIKPPPVVAVELRWVLPCGGG